VLLPKVFSAEEVAEVTSDLSAALARSSAQEGTIRSEAGNLYAARNLLTSWSLVASVWKRRALLEALMAALGPGLGLVRVLFFDKPPNQSWGLPWHKDLTIAVRENRLPSQVFGKPTRKAGVPHVEAPTELLQNMLTARIHLDDVSNENGPLKVL